VSAEADVAITVGQPLYIKPDTHAGLAQGDTQGTLPAGLAYADAASGHAVEYLTDGVITQSDWTNVTGAATLTIGVYYLSVDVAGQLTPVAPTITGYVVRVGRALSPDTFSIEIEPPIQL
jgi:hypothetical protein